MDLSEKDFRYIWHPYTHQQGRIPAIPIVKGKGVKLIDEHGRKYIDGISSWWVNIHGHGNKFIAKKIFKQAKKLQQVIFTRFTHQPGIDLAEKLLEILPGSFKKVFYSDNGSTATEVAIKMALQFWINNGAPDKNKIIAFQSAYHGDTFGAMSISQRGTYTYAFQDKLFEVVFLDTPRQENIQTILDKIDACKNDAACFIFEPLLQGAGGMKMYGAKELDTILSHLKKHEIICIADEVLTGFYRTGKMFAGDYLDEKADIICLSKALTGGTMALGVTGCTAKIYNSFVSDNKNKTLFHGHSFTANPLACTAALASLELLNKKSCRNKIKILVARQEKFLKKLRPFLQTVVITNLRCLGTIVAFEVKTTDGDGYLNSIAEIFTPFCMARGVYLRSLGNTIYVMPPYCTRKKELKKIHNVVIKFLQKHQA